MSRCFIHLGNEAPGHTPPHCYLPGQTISGKVVFELAKDHEIPKVSIRFRGKLKVVIQRQGEQSTQSYRYTFFSFEQILFNGGQFKMRATTYEWPFEFTVPRNYTPRNIANEFDDNGQFVVTGPQTLPPSSDDEYRGRGRAAIIYKLYAHIPRFNLPDWDATRMVTISPARMEASPELQYVAKGKLLMEPWERYRYRYDANYTPRSLTKREILSDTFRGNSETQQVEFSVEISAPRFAIVGKACPISVRVVTAPTEMVLPDFKLTEVELRISCRTHVRIPGTFGDHRKTHENTIWLCSSVNMSNLLEIGEWLLVRGVFPEGGSKWKPIVPDFTSMAIRRDHAMSIRVRVTCLEKDFKFTRVWPKITFLPSAMEDGLEEAAWMIENGVLSTVAPDGEIVPDYEPESGGPTEVEAETSQVGVPLYSEEAAPPPSYKESGK